LALAGATRGAVRESERQQRGKDLLAGGEQKGPELLSPARRREAPAQDGSSAADTRPASDTDQVAA
jgi:hypothetical protein